MRRTSASTILKALASYTTHGSVAEIRELMSGKRVGKYYTPCLGVSMIRTAVFAAGDSRP